MDGRKSTSAESSGPASEQPFPLRRLFRRRIVPAFAGFLGVLLLLVGLTANRVAESIYLQLAERRAQTIARAVERSAPVAWGALMGGRSVLDLADPAEAERLTAAFGDEVRELALSDLKVYDLQRRVLFATQREKIGTTEDGQPLRDVIEDGRALIDTATSPQGAAQYELYVPFRDDTGAPRAVFELYEPVGYLNAILARAAIPALVVPGILLLGLVWALGRLVGIAQGEIDARANALNALRRRVETFLSHSAVTAAHEAAGGTPITSHKLVTTLLYTDVRGFTEFSETAPPEAVIAFLNDIARMQIAAVAAHEGDVDKLIGDAMLARFDGDDGPARAVAAAQTILRTMAQGDHPRGLGIGVYRGEVIAGAIGPEERRDFTVVGDTVNIAARLCAQASAGELVADAALAGDGFGARETVRLKGRREAVEVRRWRVPPG